MKARDIHTGDHVTLTRDLVPEKYHDQNLTDILVYTRVLAPDIVTLGFDFQQRTGPDQMHGISRVHFEPDWEIEVTREGGIGERLRAEAAADA